MSSFIDTLWVIAVAFFVTSITLYYVVGRLRKNYEQPKLAKNYEKKPFLTESEKKFLELIKPLEKYGIIIVPQVNLATIIKKAEYSRYNNELFRNIDFGLFNKDYNIKLLIELNDRTHNQPKRKYRDARVREIVESADVPIITFYTDKPNEQDYVLHRISETLKQTKGVA